MANRKKFGNTVYWDGPSRHGPLRQQNKKTVEGPNKGEHKSYDPNRKRSGYAGPKAPRRGK